MAKKLVRIKIYFIYTLWQMPGAIHTDRPG